MAYRPFFEVESEDTPATFANPATFRPDHPPTVADVASVAGVPAKTENAAPAEEPLSIEDIEAAFDERAGILEYDCGLPRDEAERLARSQINTTRH